MIRATLILLAVAIAGPAAAADPECDPNDDAYIQPFDPATGSYVRPNRDVRFCSSNVPANPTWTGDMVCRVTIDGGPYALTTVLQRELVLVSSPSTPGGAMAITCSIPSTDAQGNPIVQVSVAATAVYEPLPVPDAPVPLE
jgi:hypothetical protein